MIQDLLALNSADLFIFPIRVSATHTSMTKQFFNTLVFTCSKMLTLESLPVVQESSFATLTGRGGHITEEYRKGSAFVWLYCSQYQYVKYEQICPDTLDIFMHKVHLLLRRKKYELLYKGKC